MVGKISAFPKFFAHFHIHFFFKISSFWSSRRVSHLSWKTMATPSAVGNVGHSRTRGLFLPFLLKVDLNFRQFLDSLSLQKVVANRQKWWRQQGSNDGCWLLTVHKHVHYEHMKEGSIYSNYSPKVWSQSHGTVEIVSVNNKKKTHGKNMLR